MKKIIGLLLLILLIPINIKASTCTNEEIVELKTKVSKIEIKTDIFEHKMGTYTSDSGEEIDNIVSIFNVTINNYFNDIYINSTDSLGNSVNYNQDEISNSNILATISPGNEIVNYEFQIIDKKCDLGNMRLIKISIPKYNSYYDTPACHNHPEYYLCEKYLYINYDNAEGLSKSIDNYINGLVDKTGNPIKKDENNNFLEFIKKYQVILYFIVIVLSSFLIYRAYRRKKEIQIRGI